MNLSQLGCQSVRLRVCLFNFLLCVLFLSFASYRSPSQPLLKSLHWLPVIERVEYKLAAMTKFDYTSSHLTFSSTLVSTLSVLLTVHSNKTATAAWAFRISTRVWNSLPCSVRETSQPQFLRRLKGHLFQRVFS